MPLPLALVEERAIRLDTAEAEISVPLVLRVSVSVSSVSLLLLVELDALVLPAPFAHAVEAAQLNRALRSLIVSAAVISSI